MQWNWQQQDWPHFKHDAAQLTALESKLLVGGGQLFGAFRHLTEAEKEQLHIDLLSNEALKSAEIDGDYLNRESLQAALCRQFELPVPSHRRPITAAEEGITELLVSLYFQFSAPLAHQTLQGWHGMLANGRRDLHDMARYRTQAEPMRVTSGPLHAHNIHFEAPPAEDVPAEMKAFISWFHESAPQGKKPLPALTRAGLAHLYFVSIHPFEDGNGRIARALSEKVLAQALGQPSLIALSYVIERHRKAYFNALEQANKTNEVTEWLVFFAKLIIEAQSFSQSQIEFLIEKTRMFNRLRTQLNERQAYVLQRMFAEGPDGFKGGLNAKKYIALTGAPRATATRDLQDLVLLKALNKAGELKTTRYYLNLD